jgi:preprotein translocase subunit SecG
VLVAVVLLQPGKTDAGALFTSNISSSAFGPRGTASVLSKITIVAAVVFMLTALLISMPAFSGNISVLSGNADGSSEETQTVEQESGTANANVAPDNTNGGLVETPATNKIESDANAASGLSTDAAPANANTNAKK